MSGGHLDYFPRRLGEELFGWNMNVDYGEDGWKQSEKARKMNPLENSEVSEMCWDMICLLHSYEWWKSGDNCEERYQEDLDHFKDKWLKRTPKQRLDAYRTQLKEYADKLAEELS